MEIRAGTSGFSYRPWVGSFYPERLAAKDMLAHYGTRLPTVELNNTFYRLPGAAQVAGWRAQVPETFRFAVKAPQRMTHSKRLKDCAEELERFAALAAGFGATLGAVLFQLPPFARVDLDALAAFTADVPAGWRAAFEFRHPSWFVADVFALLRARNFALVQSETDVPGPEAPWTADWAYLRLRKTAYTQDELEAWHAKLAAAPLQTAFVYFKHEDAGVGPVLAARFNALAVSGRGRA